MDKSIGKILVVEDDATILRIVTTMLESSGHTVVSAADGEQALDVFRRDQGIELVLTDIEIPIMSGIMLASHILSLDLHVPIVFMSGCPLDLGPRFTFIAKPFRVNDLLGTIDNELARSRLTNSPDLAPAS